MARQDLLRVSLVLACLIPLALILAALFVSRKSPFRAASLSTLVTAGLSLVAVSVHAVGSRIAGAPPAAPILRGLVQLDLVSSAMLALVCTLAIVVIRYSRTYLAGEPGLVRYVRSLLLTLASVTLLVMSNHLAMLITAWLATGVGLHQLLNFYPKRRQAVIVAHKTFLLGRIADLCFFASLVLEINVNIWRFGPLFRNKSLEQKINFCWIYTGKPNGKTHNGVCGRPSALIENIFASGKFTDLK